MIILQIPLFILVLVVYNVLLFVRPDLLGPDAPVLFSVPLISGATWTASVTDILIIVSVFILAIEIFKATRTSVHSIIEHIFSMLVFIIFVVEFITVKTAGTSTFLVLMLLSFLDVIGGFMITISTARRDLAFGGGHNAT